MLYDNTIDEPKENQLYHIHCLIQAKINFQCFIRKEKKVSEPFILY